MNVRDKVKFYYVDKYGMKRQKVLTLSNVIIKEEEMSNEEVKGRLAPVLQQVSTEVLVEKGIIFAARNLLKSCADAKEIDVQQVEEKTQTGGSEAGGAILLLLILAFIVATICFPLLVILGMRGKLFLKGLYEKCQGDAYQKFVKKYTFVGIGLYALVIIMVLVDKIFELQVLFGPAFGILFFGGIAYFVISLVIVKKKFLGNGESFSFAQLLKKKSPKEDVDSECTTNSCEIEAVQDNSSDSLISEKNICPIEDALDIEDVDTCSVSNTPVEYSEPIGEEMSVDMQLENTDVKTKKIARKNYRKLIFIISIICFVLLVGGVAYWFLGKKFNKEIGKNITNESIELEKEGDESEGSKNELTDEQEKKINVNDYVGYWNIKGNSDKELTIHNGDDDTVYFSLWYYRQDEINNVAAQMQDNVASFSLAIDGAVIKGMLTFNKDTITVHITHSTRVAMPIEIMEFSERHMTSWVFGMDDTYEPADTPQYNTTETFGYILPFSSERLLTEDDVYFLTPEQLKLARNEIYARHGRIFNDQAIQDYFNSQYWYNGSVEPDDFSEDMLSQIERDNVQFIKTYEP